MHFRIGNNINKCQPKRKRLPAANHRQKIPELENEDAQTRRQKLEKTAIRCHVEPMGRWHFLPPVQERFG